MNDSLFPEDMIDMTIEEDEIDQVNEPVEYIGAVAFSDEDFTRDGQNAVKGSSGLDSWKEWCVNCLSIERYSSPLYSTDFGIAINEVMTAATREEAEAIFKAEAKEALEADPYERTDHVGAISFDWGTDSVKITIEVIGIDGATIDIDVNYEGR